MIGLGYVGLPLAAALARKFETIGFDVDEQRIAELADGHDRTGEVDDGRLRALPLALTSDPDAVPPAHFYIVAVPTPIDAANQPDLRLVEAASRTVGGMLPAARAAGTLGQGRGDVVDLAAGRGIDLDGQQGIQHGIDQRPQGVVGQFGQLL